MQAVETNTDLIAYCGLYCGSCGKYHRGKCPGCRKSVRMGWCRIRGCAIGNSCRSCADCVTVVNLKDCGKLNNIISKVFALVFRTDRIKGLTLIRETGHEEYARRMAESRRMTPLRK